ncbi:Uncharacterised protein [Salmonella enterica subsp. enterica]|uniref:Uncharacterized protein n=1 Tax=Salmonella enterica I TaxID=59201 RepID=A0A447MSM3_SALET|nr:Uncharacterised protein [Salmonella enterica subsp. enterica]
MSGGLGLKTPDHGSTGSRASSNIGNRSRTRPRSCSRNACKRACRCGADVACDNHSTKRCILCLSSACNVPPMHARFTHQLLDGFIQILLGGKTGILWSNSPDDAG